MILSAEEVDSWRDDSLKFFLDMKEESNENKGALLRGRAKRLIAGVELRFSEVFNSFAAGIMTEMLAFEAGGDLQR